MGNPDKEAIPPSAPLGTGGDELYYDLPMDGGEKEGIIADVRRPLTTAPNHPQPSQSRTQVRQGGEADGQGSSAQFTESDRMHGQYETFVLRNLPLFKGEYNDTAIPNWVQKVDLLILLIFLIYFF